MPRWTGLAAAFLLGSLLLAWSVLPPRAVGPHAPADRFSAARAMEDVRVIAASPHPAGSARNAMVRDYLISRLNRMGLEVRVQDHPLENIIAVLPGRDRAAPAVALMAHYDSTLSSPGAADDAAGVAAILETVRALRTKGVPARDVVVLLTNAEEQGLLGAKAFFGLDPGAAHIGLVINLEARGGAGRAIMFETSQNNGGLIAYWRRAARLPTAGSLTDFVYRRMPNGADLSEAKAAGKAGLNFAFIGRQIDYHAASSTPERLSQGSLQSLGSQALDAAGLFANSARLPRPARDVVYSHLFGPVLIAYPPPLGWLITAASLGLLILAARRARQLGALKIKDALFGVLASFAILIGTGALLWLARRATGVPFGFYEARPLLAHFTLWETAMTLLALAAIAAPAAALARRPGAWLGLLGAAWIAGAVLQAAEPLVAYLIAWPVLAASAAAAVSALAVREGAVARGAVIGLAAVSLGWLGGLAHLVAQGLDQPPLLALFAWLLGLSLWPLLAENRRMAGIVAGGAGLAGAVAVGVIRLIA